MVEIACATDQQKKLDELKGKVSLISDDDRNEQGESRTNIYT